MTELKPCPFCGGEANYAYDYVRGVGVKYHHVSCRNDPNHVGGVGCYAAAPGRNGDSGKCDACWDAGSDCVFAIAAWNTRAPDPAEREDAARMALEVAAGKAKKCAAESERAFARAVDVRHAEHQTHYAARFGRP